MKKFSKKSEIYNKDYFKKRDNLDLHAAASIRLLMREKKYTKVLDVGCGTGLLVNYLNKKGFEAYGCDKEEEALKFATRRDKGRIKKCSATFLKYPKGSFDLVTSISVIEHLNKKNGRKFLNEANKILKPGGSLFIITPNYATPIRLFQGEKWFGYSDPSHTTFYTTGTLSSILTKTGFRKIKTTFATSFDTPFDWDLPDFLRLLPRPLKNLITYLLVSTPLASIRNSIWISAEKSK